MSRIFDVGMIILSLYFWINAWGIWKAVLVIGGFYLFAYLVSRSKDRKVRGCLLSLVALLLLLLMLGGVVVAAWQLWSPLQSIVLGVIMVIGVLVGIVHDA